MLKAGQYTVPEFDSMNGLLLKILILKKKKKK